MRISCYGIVWQCERMEVGQLIDLLVKGDLVAAVTRFPDWWKR